MHMTRHRAKASFAVEIKRSSKRAPDVTAAAKPALTGNELANRVFGSLPRAEALGAFEGRGASRAGSPDPAPAAAAASGHGSTTARAPEPKPRRVLPDLLTLNPDPVAQRMKRQEDERAARRRALR